MLRCKSTRCLDVTDACAYARMNVHSHPSLADRDRAEVAEDFSHLVVGRDFVQLFAALGRKHFEDEPREKAILCLEIWAEAARNPTFAKLCADFEQEVVKRLTEVLQQ